MHEDQDNRPVTDPADTPKEGKPIRRTPAEIIARMDEVAKLGRDALGVERSRLLEALPFVDAKKFLVGDHPHTPESWEAARTKTVEQAQAQIVDYLEFAWVKANQCNGTSTTRSISHFRGLLWLIGDNETLAFLEDPESYAYFGKPQLVKLCERFGFDWRQSDNDEWVQQRGDEPLTADAVLGT